MHNLEELAVLSVEIAVSAGKILVEGRKNGFAEVGTKSSANDIVTEIDLASEQHIVKVLEVRRPDDGILGEEGTSKEGKNGIRWVIDPLDGTVNFTYDIPAYAVSIGVEIDGIPTIGAVYNPASGELFRAINGQGAYCNDVRLGVNEKDSLSNSLIATGFGYEAKRRALQGDFLQQLIPHVRDIRRGGSAALDLCWVAKGRLDAYYELGVRPWDTTAGEVIATEAGAIVSNFKGERPDLTVLAASPGIHAQLLEKLASHPL